jgi:hypothetical protein
MDGKKLVSTRLLRAAAVVAIVILVGLAAASPRKAGAANTTSTVVATADDANWSLAVDDSTERSALDSLVQGRHTFRFDTFGDQAFWGGTLQLHRAIAGAKNGGVGPGVSPKLALAVGLKVDVTTLPLAVRTAIRQDKIDLTDPAVTLDLLKLNSVVGVRGFFKDGRLTTVGITCALCHSTVDDSFAPGIGRRLDGWAARDLDVGTIIALAPNLQPFVDLLRIVHPGIDAATVRQVLRGWGPGKFDAELILDGKAARPDGKPSATLIPPAFGLAGVNLHTWTGWGSVTHWNAFVSNLEMHGKGTFYDPRLRDASKFPIAAAAGLDNVRNKPDLITSKLAALHLYQLSIAAPRPPSGSFNGTAAARGRAVFNGDAGCDRCHVPPLFTEPGWNMHRPGEIGVDDFQAMRSPDERYRTSPLRGLWTHGKGGYYHDGRFPTLRAVVEHYDSHFNLGLSDLQKGDLVEYLKSL